MGQISLKSGTVVAGVIGPFVIGNQQCMKQVDTSSLAIVDFEKYRVMIVLALLILRMINVTTIFD